MFTHTLRSAARRVAARCDLKHRCVFFRYEYSYVQKLADNDDDDENDVLLLTAT